MLRRTSLVASTSYMAQSRTPVLGQCQVNYDGPKKISVGYLLERQQVVKHTPLPVEIEFGQLLEREYQRYGRHEAESLTTFMATERSIPLDIKNRNLPQNIKQNFYALDLYNDANKVVYARYAPAKRLTKHDFVDIVATSKEVIAMKEAKKKAREQERAARKKKEDQLEADGEAALTIEQRQRRDAIELRHDAEDSAIVSEEDIARGPPPRHVIGRRLDNTLYLIIQRESSKKWTVPQAPRRNPDSLRTALDRTLFEQHGGSFETYTFSNAPQAVLRSKPGSSAEEEEDQLYLFNSSYLAGRPNFSKMLPEGEKVLDHAWVTRKELSQYEFDDERLFSLLTDISTESNYSLAAAEMRNAFLMKGLKQEQGGQQK